MPASPRIRLRHVVRAALIGAVALAPVGCPAPSKVICPNCKPVEVSWTVPNYDDFSSSSVSSARMSATAKYTGACPLDPPPSPCVQEGAKNVSISAPGPGSDTMPMETASGAIVNATITIQFDNGSSYDIPAKP